VEKLEDLSIPFGYNGEVTLQDTEQILQKINGVRELVVNPPNERAMRNVVKR
jgi:hypothetical protein